MILIITNSKDRTAGLVENQLIARSVAYRRLNTDTLLSAGYSFGFGTHSEGSSIVINDELLNMNEISAVWYRKPLKPEVDETVKDPQYRVAVISEAEALLKNIYSLIPETANWVSIPENIRKAGQKLYQLQLASSIGFTIPETLVSNDTKLIREFVQKCHGKAVIKSFLPITHEDESGQLHGAYATRINDQILGSLESIKLCPVIFQGEIDKAQELRVTVVGKNVFPAAIKSLPVLDWRSQAADLVWEKASIPTELEHYCLSMMHSYGLKFGAFDFALSPSGEYFFFEMNPNGQWGWIEEQTGSPIADALIDVLLSE